MSGVRKRAESRFAALRDAALGSREIGGLGEPPAGLCLSVIARLAENSPEAVKLVDALQQQVSGVGGDQYRYPAESLHVSILGCTQREAAPPTSDLARLGRIRNAVTSVVGAVEPVDVHLGRPNLIGNQLFVEVTTESSTWSEVRCHLKEELEAIGELPITYPDMEPMHLNVVRFRAQPNIDALHRFLIDEPGLHFAVRLSLAELVLTDFLVSPAVLRVLARVPFAPSGTYGW